MLSRQPPLQTDEGSGITITGRQQHGKTTIKPVAFRNDSSAKRSIRTKLSHGPTIGRPDEPFVIIVFVEQEPNTELEVLGLMPLEDRALKRLLWPRI